MSSTSGNPMPPVSPSHRIQEDQLSDVEVKSGNYEIEKNTFSGHPVEMRSEKKYLEMRKPIRYLKVLFFYRAWSSYQLISFSLKLKEEATDYIDPQTLKSLVTKYSQFINFPIYLWNSKVFF